MKIKIFILVALVLCLTLSVGISFAEVVIFDDFVNYDFVVYGYDDINNHSVTTQSVSVSGKVVAVSSLMQVIDLNADIYVCACTSTFLDTQGTMSVTQYLVGSFIYEFSEEYIFTLTDGFYIYVNTEIEQSALVLVSSQSQVSALSLSPLLVGYEKAVPIQSGLFVDAYNWFNDTFFSGDVPPLLESLSDEFSTIFAVLFVGSIIAIPIFLVWVLFKSVIAMSLFNK